MTGAELPPRIQARVAIPFAIVTLIWSSTWLVIRWQLDAAPAEWSVTYRFAIGAAGMFAYALATRTPLRLARADLPWVVGYGAVLYAVNFNLVYRAESFITSGLVAVVFAVMIVPNAVLGRVFLGQRLSRRFLAGSALAIAGLALLFLHEWRVAGHDPRAVLAGVGCTLAALMFASAANVMQGAERLRALPMPSLIAWGMLAGTIADAALARASAGPPVFVARPGYWLGAAYLGLVASAFAFPLYFGVIRAIGPARAAYSSVLTPFLAMLLSTIFEGYRWSVPAAIGCVLALAGLVVALRARMA